MGKKRGNNEGTIYKRESDNRWVGAVTLGYNEKGNPNRRVVYGSTRAEAAKKLADLLDKFNKGLLAEPSSITVEEFATGFLERETAGKAQKTAAAYRWELNHALRFLGKQRLQSVKPLHVRQMLDRMASEGWTPKPTKAQEKRGEKPANRPYTPRTIKKALERLTVLFRDALRLEIIHRNPCEGIEVKTAPVEAVGRVLEADELAILLKACDAHPTMGMLFRLMLDTGLRKGEALALTWADIDLEASPPRLSVSKSWSSLGGVKGGIMTKPKSKNSKRAVPIPPDTASRLRALRTATVEKYGRGIQGLYLFGSPINNTPFEPNAPNHALARICKREGLKPIRPHDLRHTFGSILLANGVKLEVVSKRMGHASSTITLNVYRHLLEGEVFEDVFAVTSTAAQIEAAKPQAQALPN
jgi:integrase